MVPKTPLPSSTRLPGVRELSVAWMACCRFFWGRRMIPNMTTDPSTKRIGWTIAPPAIATMSTKIREGTEVGISSVTSMLNQAEHGVGLANDAGDAIARMRQSTNEVVRVITGDPGMAASRIAFVLQGRGSKEIYLVDSDGENVQRVTTDGSLALSPAWSPDGTKLAYTSFRSGRPFLYERDLRTGRDRVVSDRQGLNATPAYSPDGGTLAFATSVSANTEVATMRTSGGGIQQQTLHRTSVDRAAVDCHS